MSAGGLAWHLTQSALVRVTAAFVGAAIGAVFVWAAGLAADSAATATEASRNRADANVKMRFIFPPLLW